MQPWTVETNDVTETMNVAGELARKLRPGDVVALHGELGAGKTQFVRGLVAALGGDPSQVHSPTYVILHVYDDPSPVVFHIDAYRTSGPEDMESIGFDELLGEGGLVVIEWPSRLGELLPANAWHVSLEHTGETTRRITVAAPQ